MHIMGGPDRKKGFLHFHTYYSPILFFPKWGHVYLNYQNFLFWKHFCEGFITKCSEIVLCKKMAILHKLTKFEKTVDQIKPNFFILVDLKMIQKRNPTIFLFILRALIKIDFLAFFAILDKI